MMGNRFFGIEKKTFIPQNTGLYDVRYVIRFFGVKIKIKPFKLSFEDVRLLYKSACPKPLNDCPTPDIKHVNISIAAIYKNEPDIIEWIEYHKLIGVERFFLYDNESTDNSRKLLQPYIDDGTVIYQYVEGRCKQIPVYRDAIYRYKHKTNWLALIDLDEYIVLENEKLSDFLEGFKEYPAVGINWVTFDSAKLINRPNKLVIEAYTSVNKNSNGKTDCVIKSIINPRRVSLITNPHFCIYKGGKLAVDETHNQIGKPHSFKSRNARTQKPSTERIRINHYHTKSLEDYCRKKQVGYADQLGKRPDNPARLNFKETKQDYTVLKYLPELKKAKKNKMEFN